MKKVLIAAAVVLVLALAATAFCFWRYPMTIFNAMNRRALKSAGFVESRVQSKAGGQHVWEAGSGSPLVLLHGAGADAGNWSKIAPELAKNYHVIIPDLAGHGDSEPSSGPLNIGMILDGVEAVVDSTSGGQKVVLVGNSLGAWVAILYANLHPERIIRVVANSGGPLKGEREDLAHVPVNRADAARMMDAVLDPGSMHPPAYVLDDIVRVAQNGAMSRLAQSDMRPYLYAPRDITSISAPIDLIWGEADRLVPLDYARRLKAILPNSRLTTIPRCGHIPQQECPVTYGKVLRSVLSSAPPQGNAANENTQ